MNPATDLNSRPLMLVIPGGFHDQAPLAEGRKELETNTMKPLEKTRIIEFLVNLLFDRFCEHVRNICKDSGGFGGYTDHGLSHIRGVEEAIDYLLGFQKKDVEKPITPFERSLLHFAAWSHDLVRTRWHEAAGDPARRFAEPRAQSIY